MTACAHGWAASVPSKALERQAATTVTAPVSGVADGGFTHLIVVITWLALSGTSGVVSKQAGKAVPPTFTWATTYSVDVPSVWSFVRPSFSWVRPLRIAGAAFSMVFSRLSILPTLVVSVLRP